MFIKNAKFTIDVLYFGTHVDGYAWFTVNGEEVPMREPSQKETNWGDIEVGELEVLFAALASAGEEPRLAVKTPCYFIFGKVNDFKVVKHTIDMDYYGTAVVDMLRITLDGEYEGTYEGLTSGRQMGVEVHLIGNPKVHSSLVGEIDWDKYRILRDIFLAGKGILIKEEVARQTLKFLRENAAAIVEALMVAPESFTEQVKNWAQDNISFHGRIFIAVKEEDEEVAEQLRKLEQAIVLAKANDWKFLIEA